MQKPPLSGDGKQRGGGESTGPDGAGFIEGMENVLMKNTKQWWCGNVCPIGL